MPRVLVKKRYFLVEVHQKVMKSNQIDLLDKIEHALSLVASTDNTIEVTETKIKSIEIVEAA